MGVTPGWNLALDGKTFLHEGQTGGCSAFLCFDREDGVAVAVLANQSTTRLGELGVLCLRQLLGLPVAPPAVEIPARVPVEELEALVGTYTGRELRIDVTRSEDRLYARIPGQVSLRIYPRDPQRFAYRFVEAALEFERDGEGVGRALVLHQNGRDFRCERD